MTQIDPLIPFRFFDNRFDEMIAAMRTARKRYNFRRFILTVPDLAMEPSRGATRRDFEILAQKLVRIRETLKNEDFVLSWWCAPALRSGASPYTHTTDISGRVNEYANCPLDEDFRRDFSRNVALVAEAMQPEIILFEDDFEVSNQPPEVKFGCFCPLHLEAFARKIGRNYSREELCEFFSKASPENITLRKLFAELSCESLTCLAAEISHAVAAVAPETRLGLCQSITHYLDGNFTEPVAKAFAGKNRPLVRLHGTNYCSNDPLLFPETLFSLHHGCETLPPEIEKYHESDTFPHNLFYMSAGKLRGLMGAAFSYGVNGTLLYASQYLDQPWEEPRYAEMFRRERPRWEELARRIGCCERIGVRITFSPEEMCTVPVSRQMGFVPTGNPWVPVLGKMGIPYSVSGRPAENGDEVVALSASHIRICSQMQLIKLLHGKVLLDAPAALEIARRGLDSMIGARVFFGDRANFCFEKIVSPEDGGGTLIYNNLFTWNGEERDAFCRLQPLNGAEVLSYFTDGAEQPICPGMLRFVNAAGGEILLCALSVNVRCTSEIYNVRKQMLLQRELYRMSGASNSMLPMASGLHNCFMIANRERRGAFLLLTVIPLGTDEESELLLNLPEAFRSEEVEVLDENGSWRPHRLTPAGNLLRYSGTMHCMEPLYLRIQAVNSPASSAGGIPPVNTPNNV